MSTEQTSEGTMGLLQDVIKHCEGVSSAFENLGDAVLWKGEEISTQDAPPGSSKKEPGQGQEPSSTGQGQEPSSGKTQKRPSVSGFPGSTDGPRTGANGTSCTSVFLLLLPRSPNPPFHGEERVKKIARFHWLACEALYRWVYDCSFGEQRQIVVHTDGWPLPLAPHDPDARYLCAPSPSTANTRSRIECAPDAWFFKDHSRWAREQKAQGRPEEYWSTTGLSTHEVVGGLARDCGALITPLLHLGKGNMVQGKGCDPDDFLRQGW